MKIRSTSAGSQVLASAIATTGAAANVDAATDALIELVDLLFLGVLDLFGHYEVFASSSSMTS